MNKVEIPSYLNGLLEEAIRAANDEGLAISGFLWNSNPPLFVHFTNVREQGADLTALHLKLCSLAEHKVETGMVEQKEVHRRRLPSARKDD